MAESPTAAVTDHDGHEAGDAWGHAAVDWSCLKEHYAVEVIAAVAAATGIGPGGMVGISFWGNGRRCTCATSSSPSPPMRRRRPWTACAAPRPRTVIARHS